MFAFNSMRLLSSEWRRGGGGGLGRLGRPTSAGGGGQKSLSTDVKETAEVFEAVAAADR